MVKVSSKCNDGTDVTMVNEQFKSQNCGVSSCQLNNINIRWNVLDKPTLHNCKKKNAFRHKEQNRDKYQTNQYRKTDRHDKTGTRQGTSNQRRPFKNILNLTGDIYQGYWSCSPLSLDDIKCEGLMQRHSSEFEVLKG